MFVSKLDAAGNFVWAKNITGASGAVGYSIVLDAANNVYAAGAFAGTADFDPGAGTANLTSAGSGDIFVLKLTQADPLPVTFTNIKAYSKAPGVAVQWTVQTELDMDKYEVERSATGQQFLKVATVSSEGNNTAARTYTFYDATPLTGSNYYRIKSINKTGAAKISPVVRVYNNSSKSGLTIYPNPVVGNIVTISMANMNAGKYTITILNTKGQALMVENLQHNGGTAAHSFEIGNLPKGIYEVSVSDNDKTISQKLFKY